MRAAMKKSWIVGPVVLVVTVLVVPILMDGVMRGLWGGGPGERGLYMKLPLDLPRFHWRFASEQALMAGSLEVEIVGRDGRDSVLTVFRNGEMGKGWRVIETDRGEGETYFGFIYNGRVPTHHQDSVIVRFEAVEDLYGMGRWYTAVLPAGTYEAVSSYGILTGHPAVAGLPGRRTEPRAYISCWRSKWNLQVVERRGWMGTPEDEQKRFGALSLIQRFTPADRGTDNAVCVE
jgi:hypothetical protein